MMKNVSPTLFGPIELKLDTSVRTLLHPEINNVIAIANTMTSVGIKNPIYSLKLRSRLKQTDIEVARAMRCIFF